MERRRYTEQWRTEDTDKFFYEIEEKKNDWCKIMDWQDLDKIKSLFGLKKHNDWGLLWTTGSQQYL